MKCANLLTYLLTPWSRVLLEKLPGFAANQEIPRILWNPKVRYQLTSASHMSLSWANSIQSPPPLPTSWRSILILSSHLRVGLPSGLFPSGFPTKTLCTPVPSSIRATCPANLILGFITRTILGEEYRELTSSLCNFLHSPVTPSLLVPNILLNTHFSNRVLRRKTYALKCIKSVFELDRNAPQQYSIWYRKVRRPVDTAALIYVIIFTRFSSLFPFLAL